MPLSSVIKGHARLIHCNLGVAVSRKRKPSAHEEAFRDKAFAVLEPPEDRKQYPSARKVRKDEAVAGPCAPLVMKVHIIPVVIQP